MNRRNFLQKTSMVLAGLAVMPAAVLEAPAYTSTTVLTRADWLAYGDMIRVYGTNEVMRVTGVTDGCVQVVRDFA